MDATLRIAPKPRSLLPREHGAYAQLGVPLAAVLFATRPSWASAGLAFAACAAFAAHEPLLVLLGHRGARARREDGRRAGERLAILALAALVSALFALRRAPPAWPWTGAPLALAAGAAVFIARRSERSLAGELVAAAALTAAALPVAISGGMAPPVALALGAVFYLTTLLTTVEVRVISQRKASKIARVAGWVVFAVMLAALAVVAPRFALCAIPTTAAVLGIAASRPKPASLRRLGWILVIASLATAAAVVFVARAAG